MPKAGLEPEAEPIRTTPLDRQNAGILGLPKIWAQHRNTLGSATERTSEEAKLADLVGMGVRIQSASSEKDARSQV
jgi:hypothetical protein